MNGKAVNPENQQVSIRSLKSALSEERLHAYAIAGDADELDAVARYIWNLALCCAMQPALHVLEVTLRNHLFQASLKIVDESKLTFQNVNCWLDARPTLLEVAEAESVEDAKMLLGRAKKPLTPGRLISKLAFGFWVSLCKRPYEQGRGGGPALWPALAKTGFHFLAAKDRTRAHVFHRLEGIRDLRNRVSHHEPIWDRDLVKAHNEVLDALSWMNLGLATALRAASPLDEIVRQGASAFRPMAERLVKVEDAAA